MMEEWSKHLLLRYQQDYGALALVELLATTNRLYAALFYNPEKKYYAALYCLGRTPCKQRSELQRMKKLERATDRAIEACLTQAGCTECRGIFKIASDGRIDTTTVGTVNWNTKRNRVPRRENWETFYFPDQPPEWFTPQPFDPEKHNYLGLGAAQIVFVLPDSIYLPISKQVHNMRTLTAFLKYRPRWYAALFYEAKLVPSETMGAIRRVRCITSPDQESILTWFTQVLPHWGTPAGIWRWEEKENNSQDIVFQGRAVVVTPQNEVVFKSVFAEHEKQLHYHMYEEYKRQLRLGLTKPYTQIKNGKRRKQELQGS